MALTDHPAQLVIPAGARFPPPWRLRLKYDRDGDILTLHMVPPRAALSVDVCGEGWARFDPATNEIVDLEIEDFRQGFLRRHRDPAHLWHRAQSRPRILGNPLRERREFLDRLLAYFQQRLSTSGVYEGEQIISRL